MEHKDEHWECDCCGHREGKAKPHGIMTGEDAVLLCDKCYERTYGKTVRE